MATPTSRACPQPLRALFTRASAPLSSELYTPSRFARGMASIPDAHLWDPRRGIRFAEKTRERAVVYPTIDYAKFYSSVAMGEQVRSDAGVSVNMDTPVPAALTSGQSPEDAVQRMRGGPDSNAGQEVTGVSDPKVRPPDPPLTSLEYNICETAFRDAQAAEKGAPESFWSYAMYRGPFASGAKRRVKVHYCTSQHTTERACQYFLDEEVLGFDLEWVPNSGRSAGPRRNVSLIQIASPSRIALFHVALYPEKDVLVAPSLKKIMEDARITKVGVGIKADCTRLRNFLGVDAKGIFELSHLYKLVKYSTSELSHLVNKRLVGLSQQAEEYLGLPLYKGEVVRSSNWSQALDMGQIIYSASDAYAGLQLYHILEQERESLNPCPPRPFHADLNLPIRLADGVAESCIDEGAETAEPEVKADIPAVAPLPTSLAAAVQESLQVEMENGSRSTESAVLNVTPKKQVTGMSSTTKTQGSPKPPKDSRIVAAETWVAEYRASKTSIVAPARAIRAYRIWHANKTLDPQGIARLLREPPLMTNTVVGYILDAVLCEKLPFEKPRLRDEVLGLLPQEVREGRYRSLAKAAEE